MKAAKIDWDKVLKLGMMETIWLNGNGMRDLEESLPRMRPEDLESNLLNHELNPRKVAKIV